MSTAPIIEGAFLEKLERLAIRWQKSFPGLVGGHNMSRLPGSGQEFLDHRHFHHGDDLRAVNWRAYLRLEKLFLKMFQVEPRVPVRMLIDVSASMMAHGGVKFDIARKLAASLCYIGLVRLDTIEIHGFASELTLLQIWADEDRTPPWVGELELQDAETGAALKLDFDEAARERYTRSFDEYCAGIQTLALRGGGRYAGISASQSLENVIFGEL